MSGILSKRDFLEKIRRIDPYDFEQFVADVWEKRGFSTTVRSGSGDRGIDIVATNGRTKQLIQAKRYNRSNKVGSAEIRKYATLYQQVEDADNVVIVTTSTFTDEGRRLARDLDVDLVDGEDLFALVNAQAADVAIEYLAETVPSSQLSVKEQSTEQKSPFDTNLSYFEVKKTQDIVRNCPSCGGGPIWQGKRRHGIIYTLLKCENCDSIWAYEGAWPDDWISSDWEQIPSENHLEKKNSSGTGCFIATAAYGTPYAQEIDSLREFRDDILLSTSVGTSLVEMYYEYSPPVAAWISRSEMRQELVRRTVINPSLWLVEYFGYTQSTE